MYENDDWDNNIFKSHPPHGFPDEDFDRLHFHRPFPVMELVVGLVVSVGLIIILVVICRCCCYKSSGRVIAPPPAVDPTSPAPYPQQQYNTTAYPVVAPTVTVYPVGAAAPYHGPAPYPTGPHAPFPTPAPYPVGAPYPNAHPHYPTTAPYPTAAPYPAAGYSQAPTAPDANACPPSYDQVMQQHDKQPPFNPHAPH